MPKQPPRDAELLAILGRNIEKYIAKRGFETAEKFAWEVEIPKTTLSVLSEVKVMFASANFTKSPRP